MKSIGNKTLSLKKIRIAFLAALILSIFTILQQPLRAQDTLVKKPLWRISILVGISNGHEQQENNYGIAFGIDAIYEKSKNLFSLGLRSSSQIQLFDVQNSPVSLTTINTMIGRRLTTTNFYVAVNTGISYNLGVARGALLPGTGSFDYEKIKYTTVGIPLNFQFMILGGNNWGIGFDYYHNINKYKDVNSFTFSVQVGRFRKKKF